MTDRLTVEAMTVQFGGLTALCELSLRVAPGEIRGLIGPNGAGKTTAINAITGVVPMAAGRVLLDGATVSGLPAHAISRRGVGRTFQQVEPFGELSVLDNVLVGVGRHADVPFAHATFATPLARRREDEAVREALALLDRFELLPNATGAREISSPRAGYISAIDAEYIGQASSMIGAGRDTKEDSIDPAVGVILEVKVGQKVDAGGVLCRLYYTREDNVDEAAQLVEDAFRIASTAPESRELILEVVG